MSGGPIHLGLGDTITVARVRPEASTNAARHLGRDMGDIFVTTTKTRPATAPGAPRPLPGFEVTGQKKIVVARVKPEAAEIALRSRGSMSSILAQDYSKPRVQLGERPRTAPQQPIKGPIGQAPISSESAPPRVKPEASKTATLGTQGLVGRLLATSVDEARRANIEQALKSPPREKNHIQKNIQRMRRIQRAAREKNTQQTSPTQPLKALWRSEKYEHIESRVGPTTWQKKPTPNAPRPNTAPTTSSSSSSTRDNNSGKVNFVARNAKKAFSSENKLRRSRSSEELREALAKSKHGQSVYDLQVRGTVPDYLVKRKEQWKEQERENEANKPDPDCPKGHKRVPEEERRKVLANLKKSQDELEKKLRSLPVRQCDTLKYKQHKMDIEVKLNELDEAVKIFSKKKVFVRVS